MFISIVALGDGREGRNKSETKKRRDVVCSSSRSSSMLFERERESSINLCMYKKRWERELRELRAPPRMKKQSSALIRKSQRTRVLSTLLCFQCALVDVSLSLCVYTHTHTLSLSLQSLFPFLFFSFYSSLLMDPFNLLVSCDALLVPFSLLR